MNTKQNATLTFLLMILAITSNVYALRPNSIAKLAFPSTVLIVMEDKNGQATSIGSGFVIGNSQVATNFHVIEGGSSGFVKLIGRKKKYEIAGTLAMDHKHDLAILSIPGLATKALGLSNDGAPEVGDAVFAIGNPRGLEGTFSQGIVSSVRKIDKIDLLQITAPISPGSSGGPVLNETGKVVGVSVATFKGGQNLNFAVPVKYLVSLTSRIGKAKQLSGIKRKAKYKSIYSGIGNKSNEGVVIENITWDSEYAEKTLSGGGFSFSVRNKLRESIKDVFGLIIFKDLSGNPIDYFVIKFSGTIPGKLAKRMKGSVEFSVKRLSSKIYQSITHRDMVSERIENVDMRILNFDFVEESY
ncbi:MAG: S1C family serine protease [Thermodesulfobacteriota bacterium]|nr:S1C family serine protease [Thermodesulfobacteriota bacterium]